MLYCIKRQFSGTFLSTQGNRRRPAILTFKNKDNAVNVLRFYKDSEIRLQQPIVIEKICPETLAEMCKNVALDFAIMDEPDCIVYKLAPDERYLEILNRAYSINI